MVLDDDWHLLQQSDLLVFVNCLVLVIVPLVVKERFDLMHQLLVNALVPVETS